MTPRHLIAFIVLLLLASCAEANITSDKNMTTGPVARPAIVYVNDFDIDQNAVKGGRIISQLSGALFGRESRAQSLVNLMSTSIVSDLKEKGIEAERVMPGTARPSKGWLVRGVFLQADEGNRLRRAIIGFGAGQTDLQVAVAIDNIALTKRPAPLYDIQADADSGKKPGAVVTLNPYVAAAKFILAGDDLDDDVKNSAAKIADEIIIHMNAIPKN